MMKIVDMHCDTISALYDKRKKGIEETLMNNGGHVDIHRLQKAGFLLQNFAVFVNMGKTDRPMEEALFMIDHYYEELKIWEESIAPVFSYEDIERNRRAGKLSGLLTLEEGGVCGGKLSALRNFYRLGVRMMTLTWNFPNEIGYPNINAEKIGGAGGDALFFRPEEKLGLTETGIEFVREMERMGMIIDVSHLSDAGFYDVLRQTKKPFTASHSNARSVCGWVRNMTDNMIRSLVQRGGVIGLNFCPDFLTYPSVPGKPNGTIEAIVEHAKHIVSVGGIDCLGLGGDFDGIEGHEELKDCSGMALLEDAFCKAGFSAGEREKILGENVLRLYRDVL